MLKKYSEIATLHASLRRNGETLTIVKLLLDHDATLLNMPCRDGTTLLYIAAQGGQTDIVNFLLTCKDVAANLRFRRGFDIYVAARNGHAQVVKLFLKHKNILINAADDEGSTGLYVAAQNGYDKVVASFLADSRINVNPNFLGGYIPLYAAAQNGHPAVVAALLTHRDTLINKELRMA